MGFARLDLLGGTDETGLVRVEGERDDTTGAGSVGHELQAVGGSVVLWNVSNGKDSKEWDYGSVS